ncbi:H(+)/Cl(-) exchange transporter ClcA [Kaistia dalseonensis]|uniref:CIC family chloride channel protein n=1 Tax=Kaistia dalseonensis TaxID=410840 RepID=A0ABU0H3P9_9HYPH|nr:H(+)/Cl(-) exchange transporter ClcA [Kaistia dalseonensis]MCX5494340.1 H(+)/Cl(-) exchange transporter ClcA [Kaistia dalseonensis]MDQ0436921.1 CIC family chloride channel protein [Kaistia dalseonensis]
MDERDRSGGFLALAILAPVVGALAGLVGALFRLSLDGADSFRNGIVLRAHDLGLLGLPLVMVLCAAGAWLAAWLVRSYAPPASGSGIPHVEAVLLGRVPPATFSLIPVKFFGGVLAIGSGLALGREGPTVQMGATLAHLVGRLFRVAWADSRVLLAAGAGAGLATAFNAPIAGAVFVQEELVRRFEPRIAIAALGASATAIGVSRLILGDAPDFEISALAEAPGWSMPLYVLLGVASGLMAIAYNRTLLACLGLAGRFGNRPEIVAALIGAVIGAIAWFGPGLVGGGDPITARMLLGEGTLAMLPLVFLLRFGLSTTSYAAGTPGGLFAPMLVLGSQLGLFFGLACVALVPGLDLEPRGFAVVGMAALFTGIVRAPLTGIVLVTEMTGSVTLLLPMLAACFAAMLVPTLLRDPPIYDSLRDRMPGQSPPKEPD